MQNTLTKETSYYYTQCFPRGGNVGLLSVVFITFASSPTEAKELAKAEVLKRYPGCTIDNKDIHLYHKNYIRDARVMVSKGNYVGNNPLV